MSECDCDADARCSTCDTVPPPAPLFEATSLFELDVLGEREIAFSLYRPAAELPNAREALMDLYFLDQPDLAKKLGEFADDQKFEIEIKVRAV